jgi:hypothetical protein
MRDGGGSVVTLPEFTDDQIQELADRAGASTITILRRVAGLPVFGAARVALIDRVLADAIGPFSRKTVTMPEQAS